MHKINKKQEKVSLLITAFFVLAAIPVILFLTPLKRVISPEDRVFFLVALEIVFIFVFLQAYLAIGKKHSSDTLQNLPKFIFFKILRYLIISLGGGLLFYLLYSFGLTVAGFGAVTPLVSFWIYDLIKVTQREENTEKPTFQPNANGKPSQTSFTNSLDYSSLTSGIIAAFFGLCAEGFIVLKIPRVIDPTWIYLLMVGTGLVLAFFIFILFLKLKEDK